MKPIAIAGRWYKDRVGMARDQYVCGFGPNGNVVTMSSTSQLRSYSPEFFRENYQPRPETVKKFCNVYYNTKSKAVNFGQTSHDSREQAESYGTGGGSNDWIYAGAYPVNFTVPGGE